MLKQISGKKTAALLVFVLLLVSYYYFNLGQYFNLSNLKQQQTYLSHLYLANPIIFILVYAVIYILSVSLSLPGASLLTLAAGAFFGLALGTLVVSLSSTIGATIVFIMTKYFFREWFEKKFKNQSEKINLGLKKDGPFYLFSLRLIPIFPFFLVNILMGLTQMPAGQYFWVSLIGMLPGTLVYVNAGTELAKINTLNDISSPTLIWSFVLLGLMPVFFKWLLNSYQADKYLRKFKKPRQFDYNLIVIGGGSAGLVASYIGSAVKAKVLLIEKHQMGGDCLNTGCVPSKAFIKSAKVLQTIKKAHDFGIHSSVPVADFREVMSRVKHVIKKIEPHDSIERYTELGVECVKGNAFIKSPFEVEVNGQTLTTKNIVVATGAKPLIPDIPGLEASDYLTSDTVWNLNDCPEYLVVLGGGPIGCELAQSFARFGSKVTVIELSSHLLPREDDDVSQFVLRQFQNEGIQVLLNHFVRKVDAEKKILVCEFNQKVIHISFSKILLAVGRVPRTSGFGLEKLGIEMTKKGYIAVDEYMRTTKYPNIYVSGDVAGPYLLTHVAAHQSWYASVNALFGVFKKFKVDYRVIPHCTFIDPEVARVGLNEKEAREKEIEFDVTVYHLDDLDRALADGEDHGFVKVLTLKGSDKILGATIVGSRAGELLAEFTLAMKYHLGLNKILSTIHIYPTFSEANKYVAGEWRRKNTSLFILKMLSKFHKMRR
jgi:dihydrolipoamide dehydrogenase